MKITKLVHSCLLVEMPDRTALFDPGVMSEGAVDVDSLTYLDDIFITHEHPDHLSLPLVKKLVEKFPNVRITAPQSVVDILNDNGVRGSVEPPQGATVFTSPHESVEPVGVTPDEQGYHYLGTLSHPGDSHHFDETKPVLALPVTAPWGCVVNAVKLAQKLKPRYVIPIHDWHWNDAARAQTYAMLSDTLGKEGIIFISPENGVPFTVEA